VNEYRNVAMTTFPRMFEAKIKSTGKPNGEVLNVHEDN
jgi:hypothetical protein